MVEEGSRAEAAVRTFPVSVQDKSAYVSFDGSLFWLNRRRPGKGGSSKDAADAFVCVPHCLVLYASFIPDSDGGSLLLRLLTPPSTTGRSPLSPFKPPRSRAAQVVELSAQLDSKTDLSTEQRLSAHLQGPCQNLRPMTIEARLSDPGLANDVKEWAEDLMRLAYPKTKAYRKLKVLINPVGGPGKALPLFHSRIQPVLEAAGCVLDIVVTKYVNHGLEIAQQLPLSDGYDAIVCVSGDGMLHEVLNGLASRSDAREALRIPVVPVPTGSGNAVALNLLGVEQGFNLALACLNVIKGKEMALDVCSVTQPADPADQTVSSSSSSTLSRPYSQHYSFLSQAIGLMADVDLGTEDMRALGDSRFVIGYIGGVLSNKECEVDVYVKPGPSGSKDKSDLRRRVVASQKRAHASDAADLRDEEADPQPAHHLRNGAATDALPDIDNLPTLNLHDPSWHNPLLDGPPDDTEASKSLDPNQWYKIDTTISTFYAGKIPYVARDLLCFPYAIPGDGCVDIALQLHRGGRSAKFRAIQTGESGALVFDPATVYIKVEAYRVVPRLSPGHKRLKKGGLVSIDGEHRPYRTFQVEVNPSIQLKTLSLYGKWVTPDVPPPGSTSTTTNGAKTPA